MRKRFLSTLLVSAMLATTLLAGCGEKKQPEPTNTPAASDQPETSKAPDKQDEALPEAKYYFSMDKKDGTDKIHPAQKGAGSVDLIEKEVVFIPGVKGDALYTDGISGYKLDVNGVGDTYTLSFWTYATRFADYMPSIQLGPDVHGDATGSEHYLNITRTGWNAAGPSFPCIWSRDGAADLWPAWAPAEADEHMKQWLNITLVVDPSKLSEDGNCIAADLYLNGQLFGEGISVVNGTMTPSDNFDFLIGVNYWDATFKGAFDEIYVFDKALTPGQVATLYKAGDATAKYEEPTRVIDVKKDDNAIASLGALDFSVADVVYDKDSAMTDGHTLTYKLKHWSDGKDTKNNYYFLFKDAAGNVVARVNADMTGTLNGAEMAETSFTYSWGNWNTWEKSVMVETSVKAAISREGDNYTVKISNVDYNGTDNAGEVKFTAANVATVTVGTAKAYTDILSVVDQAKVTGKTVGSLAQGFWQAFSDIWAVPAGTSKTINFTNFTAGDNNWENFVVILQNVATGHSAEDTAGYLEYGVMRADNYGWKGALNTANNLSELGWEVTSDWNWDTFKSDLDGAKVALTVTNNGTTADVVAVVTTAEGKTYTQSYKNIAIDGDLYVTLTLEKAYLVFEPTTVGSLAQPFWSAFSDIWAVPANGSKTVKFKNYTAGDNNWENFVVILQNTPTGHSSDPALPTFAEGYAEYGVMRADNYGWKYALNTGSNLSELGWEVTSNWNWDTYKSDMDGADVEVTVTNNGTTADVVAVVTTAEGKTYTQSYKNIAIDGPLYMTFTLEKAQLIFE